MAQPSALGQGQAGGPGDYGWFAFNPSGICLQRCRQPREDVPGSGADSSVAAALPSPRKPPGNSPWLWKCGPGGESHGTSGYFPLSVDVALAVGLWARSGWPVQPMGIGQLYLVPVKHLPILGVPSPPDRVSMGLVKPQFLKQRLGFTSVAATASKSQRGL